MKIGLFFLLTFYSSTVWSYDVDSMIDAFVHVKCQPNGMTTLLVLENKTPYAIRIKKNGVISESELHPSVFSISDVEMRHKSLAGTGGGADPILKAAYGNRSSIKKGDVSLEPFAKKYWLYQGLEKYYKFDAEKTYLISTTFFPITVVYEDSSEQRVNLSSNLFIIPDACIQNEKGK